MNKIERDLETARAMLSKRQARDLEVAQEAAGALERLINEKLMRLYQEAAVRDDLAAMDAYNAALEAVEQSCESLKLQRGWEA